MAGGAKSAGSKSAKSTAAEQRRQRLAVELKANITKRKQQARARAAATEPPAASGRDKSGR